MVRRQRANNPALSYLGVSAEAPPDVVIIDRDPKQTDIEFEISTLWLRRESTKRAFMLLGKEQGIATWVQLYPVGGSPGAQNFITANGTATVNNGDITVAGGIGLQARASGANEFLIEPDQPNLGFIFMSGVGFRPVTSPDNSIDVNFANTGLELKVSTNIAQGVRDFDTDSGTANPISGTVNILGGQNITTSGVSNVVEVATKDTINLPNTVDTNTGVYKLGTRRVIHNKSPSYNNIPQTNFFAGTQAGNYSSITSPSDGNLGVGVRTLRNMTTGQFNCIVGNLSGGDITTGGVNTVLGYFSLALATTTQGQIVLGSSSGDNYQTTNEANNIIIGNFIDGVANDQNTIRIGTPKSAGAAYDRFFAAGIHNTTPASGNQQTVIVDDQGQLGATTAGAATDVVASVITNLGTATPNSSDELEILGGQNINTTASGDVVTVATDDSIDLPDTTATATGTYRIDGEPVVHIYGASGTDANLFLGVNSGNFTLTTTSAQRNTGVGTDTLFNLSSGANNVAAGAEALQNLTTGNDNIAVGFGAGSAYTTNESNNILIGNDGVGGDMNTIRIGEQGTQTRAFVAGVHDVTPAGTDVQTVTIDSSGQLGSTSSTGGGGGNTVAFTGIQESTFQVNGLPYELGTQAPLVEQYDIGNNFYPGGSGTAATFTAPADGRYTFHVHLLIGGNPNLIEPPRALILVNGSDRIGGASGSQPSGGTPLGASGCMLSATVNVTSGDVVTFVWPAGDVGDQVIGGFDRTWVSGFQVG